MTREEAERALDECYRALDECYRELRSLLNRYGAVIEVESIPEEYQGYYELLLRIYDSTSEFRPFWPRYN